MDTPKKPVEMTECNNPTIFFIKAANPKFTSEQVLQSIIHEVIENIKKSKK